VPLRSTQSEPAMRFLQAFSQTFTMPALRTDIANVYRPLSPFLTGKPNARFLRVFTARRTHNLRDASRLRHTVAGMIDHAEHSCYITTGSD